MCFNPPIRQLLLFVSITYQAPSIRLVFTVVLLTFKNIKYTYACNSGCHNALRLEAWRSNKAE